MIKNHIVYNPVLDWRFDLAKAEGDYLWDKSGNKYIDFSSAWNTTNLGWNNPEVNQAVKDQLNKNTFSPMWLADEMQIKYAEALTAVFPKELDAVCRATGGTEANEMALKIARAVTGRSKIVSFAHTYHGQSFGTLALGYIPAYVKAISPVVPDFIQMDYPNVFSEEKNILSNFFAELEVILKNKDVAAVFTEAGMITGWGSMLVSPEGFLSGIRKLTEKYGTLLVVDEVGSGFSRTGKLFAIEHEQVIPDIITLAKGIGNGAVPLGALVTKGQLVENFIGAFKPTSTNGWTPLACAAGLKTLEIHLRDKVWEHAEAKGELIKNVLKHELEGHRHFNQLRGKGMEIAFNLGDNSNVTPTFTEKCMNAGLHLAYSGNCVQIMPPLTMAEKTIIEGLEKLISVIKSL